MDKPKYSDVLKEHRIPSGNDGDRPRNFSPSRIYDAEKLFGSDTEIGIVYRGSMYRLRVTRGGKLILNK